MKLRITTGLALALALAAAPALAQMESPLLSKIQPNIVNPGGKSLAMGGAFVSVADDPTAAYANPAGLPSMGSWQVGASGKGFKFEPNLSSGNYFENPVGTFGVTSVDVYQPTNSVSSLEFASIVGPIGKNVTFAVYSAVNLRYRLDASDLTGGSYRAFFINRGGVNSNSVDEQGGVDIQNQMYGASIGARFGGFSLGGGVTYNKLTYDLTGGTTGGPHTFIANAGNPSGSTEPRLDAAVSASIDSNNKLGWVLGARWVLSEQARLAIGAVYRRSPDFDINYSIHSIQGNFTFSCGVDIPGQPGTGASACGKFHVPDDWSVGISGLLFENFFVALEVQRVRYSQLNNGFVPVFAYTGCTPDKPTCAQTERTRAITQGSSDDGTLPRAGAEYTIPFSAGTEVNLRGGWYREPAHGTKINLYPDANRDRFPDSGQPVTLVSPPFTSAFQTSFDGGSAENHYSFGLGATFARRFSLDIAVDIGKTTRQMVASAFYRF